MQISGTTSGLSSYYAQYKARQNQASGKDSAEEQFAKADTDGSGGVSLSEFSSLFSTARTEASNSTENGQTGQGGTPPSGPPPAGGPPPSGGGGGMEELTDEEVEQLFLDGDTDGDGVLSAEELAALREQNASSSSDAATAQSGQSILSTLGNASSYEDLLTNSGELSSFASLMQSFTGSSNDTSTTLASYMQNMVKQAYGA